MGESILIVEDEFIVANDLKLMLTRAGHHVCGIASNVSMAQKMIEKHRPSWVMLDIVLKDNSFGTDLAQELSSENIGFIYISASTNQSILERAKETQPYGFLMKPFREKDILMMLDIATNKHKEHTRLSAEREIILQKHLLHIKLSSTALLDRLQLLPGAFQGFIPFDILKINLTERPGSLSSEYGFVRISFEAYNFLTDRELLEEMGTDQQEIFRYRPKQPLADQRFFLNGYDFSKSLMDNIWEAKLSKHFNLQSKLIFSFTYDDGKQVALSFYSQVKECFNYTHLLLLQKAQKAIKAFFEQSPTNSPTIQSKPLVKRPEPVTSGINCFEGIVGSSPKLLKVFDDITSVAEASVSVLILGESGTGKELVAKAIHKRSQRRNKPLIIVNCAALPSELLESELFGHEKGAFTGAIERRAGKFEAADGGTIFLDEIGELSLEAQVKLLRVLQEHEFERIGSTKTIKIDVRVIAATNRNLEKEVAGGRIRLDFYYRLNVFPIHLPSLSERKEDIPALAQYFVDQFAKTMNRDVLIFSNEAIEQLTQYDWPGNIRELEHLIERTVLMTAGSEVTNIAFPDSSFLQPGISLAGNTQKTLKTLEQIEMEYILEVLKQCNGKINGPGGAAEILGLSPSTLNSKLNRLGIKRNHYF
ncbi:MAG: sigma 54-interacting response regulator [Mucilaginibacter sp.]|uniref:sigma 54-interacting response regulator n=1 Tax=Mucilaginibacter sp. TaxID=1882438 RepID=UPI0031B43952